MSKPSHMWMSAFPVTACLGVNGDILQASESGLSQYAFVAMTFQAPLIRTYSPEEAALHAFKQADAFFAELAKRTQS